MASVVVVVEVVGVELVDGSVVDDVVLVVGANEVVVLVLVVSTAVDGVWVEGAGVVGGALASAPLHAPSSITAASSARFDVALAPAMPGRSYGPTPAMPLMPGH